MYYKNTSHFLFVLRRNQYEKPEKTRTPAHHGHDVLYSDRLQLPAQHTDGPQPGHKRHVQFFHFQNEVELVNRDGVKITIVGGLDTTGSVFGPQLKLRVENSSGHNITVQSRKTSVNGYTMGDFGAIMSIDVTNGEKAYGTFTLYNSKLQDAGITTIQNIKTSFHVYDSDSWNTLFDTDLITIKF